MTETAEQINAILAKAIPIGILCVVAVLGYLVLLAILHHRSRCCLEFHQKLVREVKRLKEAKAKGEEVRALPVWEEMEKAVRIMLEEEGLLPPGKPA